jgi:uncharacterized protein HemX
VALPAMFSNIHPIIVVFTSGIGLYLQQQQQRQQQQRKLDQLYLKTQHTPLCSACPKAFSAT